MGTLLALGGGLLAGRAAVVAKARQAFTARGCTTITLGWQGATLRASGVECEGVHIREVRGRLFPREIVLVGVDVDLTRWLDASSRPDQEGGTGGPSELRAVLACARVESLDFRVGEVVLTRGLAGSLWPPALISPDTRFELHGDTYHLEHTRELDGAYVEGRVELRLDWAADTGAVTGTVRGDGLRVHHPLLGDQPLTRLALAGEIRGHHGGFTRPELEGTIGLGGPRANWHAWIDDGEPTLTLELADAPAADWLAPLAPLVPELATSDVHGDLGAHLRWTLGGKPVIEARIGEIGVSGALPVGLDLRYGPFTIPVPDSDGELVPRRFGEGTPGWVPLEDISPDLVHAVLAAEDASFFQHAGYDPAAIQTALDADLDAGEVQRGGSTISQQLAKNLFLDGEQTLTRKLRELLLAVELDHTLGKERVLELYLNIVELGPGIHGVGQACEHYLMKRPARVTPLEGAFLAALLPNPRGWYTRWYLEGHPNRAKMDAVLDNMADAGWLGVRATERWKRTPLVLVPPPK